MMQALGNDQRLVEYRLARGGVSEGLSAPPGARERFVTAIGPYLELLAEHAPPGSPARKHLMRTMFLDDGLPLGSVLAAFRATKEEREFVEQAPPLIEEPADEMAALLRLRYAAYLRTPHWQRVRAEALQRAENRCQICNASDRLQVHHRDYRRRGCERPSDVVVLCDQCHGLYHDDRDRAA